MIRTLRLKPKIKNSSLYSKIIFTTSQCIYIVDKSVLTKFSDLTCISLILLGHNSSIVLIVVSSFNYF